jgi:hypothetical protein
MIEEAQEMAVSRIQGLSGINENTTLRQTETASDVSFSDLLTKQSASGSVDLDAVFQAASQKYGVSTGLLKSVASAESGFDPKATSKCGAMGIMQLMPETAKGLGVTDAYNPQQNIMGGAKYLSQLLNRFNGDTKLAVAAYNAGPGNVEKYGGVPPFAETQAYVQKVLGTDGNSLSAGSAAASSSADVSGTGEVSTAALLAEMMKNMALSSGIMGLSGSSSGSMMGGSDSSGLSNLMMMSLAQTWLSALDQQTETAQEAETKPVIDETL